MQESISIIQLAAIAAGYLLALSRLLDVARPLWHWAPQWLQLALPALVVTLPDFASALGLVKTPVDLMQSIVVAIGTMTTAMRGALPKKVFDKLPPEAQMDLKIARKGKPKEPKISRAGHPPLIALCFGALCLTILVACAASQEKPPCDEATAAAMAAKCAVRAELECVQKGISEEDCPVVKECNEAADKRQKECLQ